MRNNTISIRVNHAMQTFIAILCSLVLGFGVSLAIAVPHSDHESDAGVEQPEWMKKLEDQVRYEEMMSGMEGRQDQLDKTLMKLMLKRAVIVPLASPLSPMTCQPSTLKSR